MKWENHKDHVGFDWLKEGIYLDDIQKFKDNCKMSVMDSLENIGTVIKSKQLKVYDITLEDGTKKEDFSVPFDSLTINISEDFSWSQNYDEILDYLESKYKSLVRDFRYNIG